MTKKKKEQWSSLQNATKDKNVGRKAGTIHSNLCLVLVREGLTSLYKIRAIRPSAVFGTRTKAALRGEGFAWVPDL